MFLCGRLFLPDFAAVLLRSAHSARGRIMPQAIVHYLTLRLVSSPATVARGPTRAASRPVIEILGAGLAEPRLDHVGEARDAGGHVDIGFLPTHLGADPPGCRTRTETPSARWRISKLRARVFSAALLAL